MTDKEFVSLLEKIDSRTKKYKNFKTTLWDSGYGEALRGVRSDVVDALKELNRIQREDMKEIVNYIFPHLKKKHNQGVITKIIARLSRLQARSTEVFGEVKK